MQLIGTLAAGVVGAEHGYATILVRGSSKRARYFSDFEGTNPIEGSDLLLDENGGAVVYVNVTVDVLIYAKNDQLIRRWVEASTAACVEVISPSFTGADYETGEGGPNRPTTVAAAFDRLLTSFGAEDFLVKMQDGSKVTMQEAIASITAVFRNVQSPLYGATGKGLVNDRPAIQAAINAAATAGGGTVFFPAGTYLLDTVALTLPRTVNLVGSGAAATRLVSPSSFAPIIQPSGTGLAGYSQIIQGLTFSHNNPTASPALSLAGPFQVTIKSCTFEVKGADAITAGVATRILLDDCDFTLSGVGGALDAGNQQPQDGRIDVRRCRFVMQGGGAPTFAVLRGANLHVFGSVYDGTSATTSNVSVIKPENLGGLTYGSVRCCEFIDSATRPIICMNLGSMTLTSEWFTEDGNICTFLSPTTSLFNGGFGAAVGYYARLGTRESRISSQTTASTAITLLWTREFGVYNVRFTGTANFTITADSTAPLAAKLRVLVVNGDTAARTVSFGTGTRGGAFVLGAAKMIGFEFVRAVANNGTADVAAWYLIGTSGILTTGTDSGYAI